MADDGMTANPWPSSDWVAFVSERGVVAAVALLGVFTVLLLGGMRRWSELGDSEAVLAKLVLAGTIAATLVVSAFDAALLLAAPAFLVWSVLGAASGVGRSGREVTIPRGAWTTAAVAALAILAASVARSSAQTAAIQAVENGGHRAGWVTAAAWDPGSYWINLRVAQLYAARGRCSFARPYVRRARGLFPNAPAAKELVQRCG